MSGEDIIETLIKLLEAQENIKITYEITGGDKDEIILTSDRSA